MVSQIGINLTLRSEDTATWLRRCYTDYDFDIDEPFSSAGADPVIGVHRHHASSAIWQGKTFVNNKEQQFDVLDRLMGDATRVVDRGQRADGGGQSGRVASRGAVRHR